MTVFWSAEDFEDDLVDDRGEVLFSNGQTLALLPVKIRGDRVPELDETFTVKLTEVSSVSLKVQVTGHFYHTDYVISYSGCLENVKK